LVLEDPNFQSFSVLIRKVVPILTPHGGNVTARRVHGTVLALRPLAYPAVCSATWGRGDATRREPQVQLAGLLATVVILVTARCDRRDTLLVSWLLRGTCHQARDTNIPK
jgi:hypothetical protein